MRGVWLGLLIALTVPAIGAAGEGMNTHDERRHDCPPNVYHRWSGFWAPGLWRARVHHQPIGPYIYPAPDCHPIAPRPVILAFPCRAVEPAAFPYGDLRGLR